MHGLAPPPSGATEMSRHERPRRQSSRRFIAAESSPSQQRSHRDHAGRADRADGLRAASRLGGPVPQPAARAGHPDPTVPVRDQSLDLGAAGRHARRRRDARAGSAARVRRGNRLAAEDPGASRSVLSDARLLRRTVDLLRLSRSGPPHARSATRIRTNKSKPKSSRSVTRGGSCERGDVVDMKTVAGLGMLCGNIPTRGRPGGRPAWA